jgi:hypothetical protein
MPPVVDGPIAKVWIDGIRPRACTSVFRASNSSPRGFLEAILETAFPPAPPTPTTRIRTGAALLFKVGLLGVVLGLGR